ncbi:hypothetical protein Tco_0265654 [Tanacetum coccineum]
MTQATIQAGQITTESVQRRAPGHVARECKEKKRARDSQWFKDKALLMEAKEKGVILDAEAEAFLSNVEFTAPYDEPLAITTTTEFETGPSTGQGTSNDTDFHSERYTGGEQLDSDVDSVIDDHDNTIPYHQYQLNNEVESVSTDVLSIVPGEIYVITILDYLRSQLEGHIKTNEEQSFANDSLKAELERYKTQVQNLKQKQVVSLKQQFLQHVESNKSLKIESEKLKADKNAFEESYLEELVWLRNTNKVVMELLKSYGQPVQTVPMLSKRPTFSTNDLHKSALGHRNPLLYDSEETLVQAEVSRTKMLERMKDPLCKVSSKPINYAKLNSLYDTFVPQKQLGDKEYDQCVIDKKSLEIENKNLLIQNECLLAESVSKDICSVVLTSDIVVPMSVEPRSNCVEEHSRNLELEAEILKMKQLLVEKEKRCSFIETKYQELELKFQKYKECFENPQVCNNSSSPELNVFLEINKLKDQIQRKDKLIRKLKAQISNMKEVSTDSNMSTLEFQVLETENTQLKEELTAVRIKNDSLRDENIYIKKRYQDLYKSKAESNSNVSSRAVVPEKPKVLAPGLYAMTPKYVPPQKRNNRETNTSLPRKETVSLVKQTNVCVNLSTGIKSVTEASKSKSKCEAKTHKNLPARSENVKRVYNPLRSLNKRNRVDSSLSVKRTRFISISVSVCNICNECLLFGNDNMCSVKNLNSVNAKNPKVKNNVTMRQVWKATGKIFASVGSKWRPTGRKFTLGDTCPLTRITKPEVVPLEKSESVSTSELANNVIVTPRTASIREFDTLILEDLKALSWKTCQGGSYNEST